MGQRQQRGAAGVEQLPAQLQELPGPDESDELALDHVRAAGGRREPARLRRADDDVRQSEVPRSARRAWAATRTNYRLPWEKAAAEPALVLRRHARRAARRRRAAQAELSHLRPLFAGDGAGIAGRPGRALRRRRRSRPSGPGPPTRRPTTMCAGSTRCCGAACSAISTGADAAAGSAVDAVPRRSKPSLPLPRIVAGIADCGPAYRAAGLRARRLHASRAKPSPRRYLEVLAQARRAVSHRAAAAGWSWPSGSPAADNPLTARVMVNRVWHHCSAPASSARSMTSATSASCRRIPSCSIIWPPRFVDEGWSVKRLIRSARADADVSDCRARLQRRPAEGRPAEPAACTTIPRGGWRRRRSAMRSWPRPAGSTARCTA